MRIDYSEPKQSYVTGQIKARPRKEPKRFISVIVIFTVLTAFIGGFGAGWFFSQKAAKKAFQAATEQSSLENTPVPPQVSKTQPATQVPTGEPPQSPTGSGTPPLPVAADPPLSFYKNLPNGQKSNVIGSGINNKNEASKQPIQAAIPSNLAKSAEHSEQEQEDQAGKKPEKAPLPAAAAGSFAVQVGSYTLKSEAEILKNKLAAKGYNVSVSESNQGEKGIWYRVRVGKKLEKEAAKELASKIGKGAVVVSERD